MAPQVTCILHLLNIFITLVMRNLYGTDDVITEHCSFYQCVHRPVQRIAKSLSQSPLKCKRMTKIGADPREAIASCEIGLSAGVFVQINGS